MKRNIEYPTIDIVYPTHTLDLLEAGKVYPMDNYIRDLDIMRFGLHIKVPAGCEDPYIFIQEELSRMKARNQCFMGYMPGASSSKGTYRTPTTDKVIFNGTPMDDVLDYSEANGEVHYYERDWNSKELIPDDTDPTGFRTGKSKGEVKVEKSTPAWPPASTTPQDGSYDGATPANNYTPWYPYGCPGFRETVSHFGFTSEHKFFSSIIMPNGVDTTVDIFVLSHLTIDGQKIDGNWTMIDAQQNGDDLIVALALLDYTFAGGYQLVDTSSLTLQTQTPQGYLAPGMPHVYRVVKIAYPSCLRPVDSDPKNWSPGDSVSLKDSGQPGSCAKIVEVLRKLC